LAQPFTEIEGFRCYAPDMARSYADYPSDGFDVTAEVEARSFWCRTRNRIIGSVIERFTDRSRTLDMLEIGCGIGGVVAGLRRFDHLRLTASEIYIQALRYARERVPGVQFIQLDATEMPFRAEFDLVGAFDVLEHIQDDERVISGVSEALRPGGLFLVTVPQHKWMWSRLDEIVCHKRRYTRAELLARLRRRGFEVLFCSSFVTLLFPAMVASRLLARVRPVGADRKEAFASEVTLPPLANRVCDRLMHVDELAIRTGVSLPFGGSLLVVARKPQMTRMDAVR
jgi:SAM-dependent methyltransferase